MKREKRDGDIIKKELTSRESWTVVERDGKLYGIPNTNKYFKDTKEIELEREDIFEHEQYIILANVSNLDFSRTGGNHEGTK